MTGDVASSSEILRQVLEDDKACGVSHVSGKEAFKALLDHIWRAHKRVPSTSEEWWARIGYTEGLRIGGHQAVVHARGTPVKSSGIEGGAEMKHYGSLRFWLSDRWRVWSERVLMWIAWHLPHQLVTWCVVRVFAKATMPPWGDTHPDEIGYGLLMKRWYEKR
jgi:hypothetical protein